jgi:hypothetical protein
VEFCELVGVTMRVAAVSGPAAGTGVRSRDEEAATARDADTAAAAAAILAARRFSSSS